MTPKRPRKPRVKTGRPTAYLPQYERIAHAMALLGATDVQLADALGVTVTTLANWRAKYPEFLAASKRGKDQADAVVAQSLYNRAVGYKHKAVKIFADPKTGAEKIVDYVERYPPDPTSMIFWLKNRRPSDWRDRRDVDVTSDGKRVAAAVIALPPEADPT